ncbi:D-alanyl-D-alanine carboxypeptidase family protein [Microbacterium sp. SORGH_AS_0888]|uniref:D-alanyl-D-alanine carboxypeptidase family protein n=1 Tax=Microbacterium sp. SORGH_AS_0888 TaxID=3041791 RepID=UPI0027D919AC|nr:D-alanyl-D-alanine carboxypeptidase [Microbacterium sp. SORGH_AS_0888]
MTPEGPPTTRRSLRARGSSESPTVETSVVDPATVPLLVAAAARADAPEEPVTAPPVLVASEAGQASSATVVVASEHMIAAAAPAALGWVDEGGVAERSAPRLQLEAGTGYVPVAADLLARAPRRSPWRPAVVVPAAFILGLVVAYCATVLLWPLYAVAPTLTPISPQPAAAAAAAPAWPAEGSASVAVDGVGSPLASTGTASAMASITKIVTALVVLDKMPLALGEQGPSYSFTYSDRVEYWDRLGQDESSLDVPVGGSLTEYQLLQGMLIGSAGNYADRLAGRIWPSDAVYADAANAWLRQHGIDGITVVEPTGIEEGNTATPAALLDLARRALANPVIAEIVRTPAVDLPGAGHVVNTNALLADPGVIGIKTGTLDLYNLLSAKQVTVEGTTVTILASVLGQPDHETRDAATRALFAQVEKELQPVPAVAEGTTVGQVDTLWGSPVGVVTASDASVVLWNGASATATTTFSLGDARDAGEKVGVLTTTGPVNSATTDLVLAGDVEGPSPWWRLTHPLQLFGLAG